jgi:hypothetical protein
LEEIFGDRHHRIPFLCKISVFVSFRGLAESPRTDALARTGCTPSRSGSTSSFDEPTAVHVCARFKRSKRRRAEKGWAITSTYHNSRAEFWHTFEGIPGLDLTCGPPAEAFCWSPARTAPTRISAAEQLHRASPADFSKMTRYIRFSKNGIARTSVRKSIAPRGGRAERRSH